LAAEPEIEPVAGEVEDVLDRTSPSAPPPRRRGFALRLRYKLALSLVIAALLPVLVASWVAVSVVLRGLENGLDDQTERQLHVGLNLFIRQVERIGTESVRLADSDALALALISTPKAVAEELGRESAGLLSSLIEVADASGAVVASRGVGGEDRRFEGLGIEPGSDEVASGVRYQRRVTFARVGDRLVVRAVAPVVDATLALRGVVVMTVPIDGAFADAVKAALGADILVFAGTAASAAATTSFVGSSGGRIEDIRLTPTIAAQVERGASMVRRVGMLGRDYAVGYAPIRNLAGDTVGVFAVAVDREELRGARAAATRSLALGAAGAFVFALGLAGLLSRRITRPIQHLHRGALAVARGDLDHEIVISEGDEIGDLAAAFEQMTTALKENQRRLAARMREIVALHDAGRAVSSVLELEQVLRKIVDSVSRVLHVRVCALWLVEPGRPDQLRLGAARAKGADMRLITRRDEVAALVEPLAEIAGEVARGRAALRINRIDDASRHRDAATAAGVTGSLVATPLERKGSVVGVIIIGRAGDARAFSEADANLLATFADHAASAIENASLFSAVRASSEELEAKVRLRTLELTHINLELGKTIQELKETQAQLILSERLAGLGQLVAGVAHEINSPTAAIRGTADALAGTVGRLTELGEAIARAGLDDAERDALRVVVLDKGPELAARRHETPASTRRAARELRGLLEARGVPGEAAADAARALADLSLTAAEAAAIVELCAPPGRAGGERAASVAVYLQEHVHLHRSAITIASSVRRIQRIVGGLKSYSHLDQEASAQDSDLHEGIEGTLVLLDHLLRGIRVARRYGQVTRIPVYVDELNQVWTNLIHNAVQALDGSGGEIAIETETDEDTVIVRVIDDGPGIPPEVMPRIFEPFFTTKPRGEGSGLGLGIARRIVVERHGGEIRVDSRPGRTCFEVRLPRERPSPAAPDGEVVG
jgi:signal transduction histidine kinase